MKPETEVPLISKRQEIVLGKLFSTPYPLGFSAFADATA